MYQALKYSGSNISQEDKLGIATILRIQNYWHDLSKRVTILEFFCKVNESNPALKMHYFGVEDLKTLVEFGWRSIPLSACYPEIIATSIASLGRQYLSELGCRELIKIIEYINDAQQLRSSPQKLELD